MKFSTTASPIFLATFLLAACAAKTSDEQQVRALIDEVETAAEARDASDVLEYVAADFVGTGALDKTQLRDFLRGYFLAHPKLELAVSIESLEFPVDGLAQGVIGVTTVELTDPNRTRLKVEFRRSQSGWQVARADRVSP
jgi:hypothetical protein